MTNSLPLRFRSRETARVFACLRAGDSCQVVGIGSVGKSNFLRFLQQEDVRRKKLGAGWASHVFVYVDANKFLEPCEWGLWELMLHQTLLELSYRAVDPALLEEIDLLHQHSIAPATRHIALRYLDRAISLVCKNLGLKLVFLFDEFDELYRTFPSRVFDAMRALRDDNKYRLMYVVATREELPHLQNDEESREAFEELVTLNTIWLAAYSNADARDTLRRLVSRHKVTLDEKRMQEILKQTGGHPGLIRTVFPVVRSGSAVAAESLLMDRQVEEECRRIWQSLADTEQKALSILVHQKHLSSIDDATMSQLKEKGLVGCNGSADDQVFSPLLEKYIYKMKPFEITRLKIDRHKHIIWVDGRQIANVPVLEFKFLDYLERRRGQVCRRDQIAHYLYPNQKLAGVSMNAIDSIVKRVRKLVETNPKKPSLISTIHGVGFRLVDGESTQASKKSSRR